MTISIEERLRRGTVLGKFRLAGIALILIFVLLLSTRSSCAAHLSSIALYQTVGDLNGLVNVEYVHQLELINNQPMYKWDFRWNTTSNEGKTYVLSDAPVFEWDVYIAKNKIGIFRDRYSGLLPEEPGVWGTGRWCSSGQFANCLANNHEGNTATDDIYFYATADFRDWSFFSLIGRADGSIPEACKAECQTVFIEASSSLHNELASESQIQLSFLEFNTYEAACQSLLSAVRIASEVKKSACLRYEPNRRVELADFIGKSDVMFQNPRIVEMHFKERKAYVVSGNALLDPPDSKSNGAGAGSSKIWNDLENRVLLQEALDE